MRWSARRPCRRKRLSHVRRRRCCGVRADRICLPARAAGGECKDYEQARLLHHGIPLPAALAARPVNVPRHLCSAWEAAPLLAPSFTANSRKKGDRGNPKLSERHLPVSASEWRLARNRLTRDRTFLQLCATPSLLDRRARLSSLRDGFPRRAQSATGRRAELRGRSPVRDGFGCVRCVGANQEAAGRLPVPFL